MSKKILEDRFTSDGNDSVPDAIGGDGHKNRPADQGGSEPMPSLPGSKAEVVQWAAQYFNGLSPEDAFAAYQKIMADQAAAGNPQADANRATIMAKEDLDSLFAGSELNEEFRFKATTLFEATVSARVEVEKALIEEQADKYIQDVVMEELTTKLDDYIGYVAETWLTENKLAVETGLRVEAVDSFLSGLKTLFTEHYVDIPEDKVNVVESITDRYRSLEEAFDAQADTIISLNKEINEVKSTQALSEAIADLTDTQKDRVRTLAEGFDTADADLYKKKLGVIVESVKTVAVRPLVEDLVDPVTPAEPAEKKTNAYDVDVSAIAQRMARKL